MDRVRDSERPETGAWDFEGVIGRSGPMQELFALVRRAQSSQATVLIRGETGTGKECIARALHAGSTRASGPFVGVNCAAFAETLLESELFGHRRGAFTGAERDKAGLFELADGGSLFLDEIGETSPVLQVKLLRALQEREIRPLGASRSRRIDVRILAATNRDLRQAVAEGRFREDLFYRLAVIELWIPPLRERRDDVPLLAEYFLRLHGAREAKPGCRFDEDARHLLLAHHWPGNVRELENEVQRALALVDAGAVIGPSELSRRVAAPREPVTVVPGWEMEPLRTTMRRVESWVIRQALERHDGHRSRTARCLGLTREGLYK